MKTPPVNANNCLVVCHGFSGRRNGYMVRVQRMTATMRRAGIQPRIIWFFPLKQIFTDRCLGLAHLNGKQVTWIPILPTFRMGWLKALTEKCYSRLVSVACRMWRPVFVQAENSDAMRLCCRTLLPVIFDMHGDTVAEFHPGLVAEQELGKTQLALTERLLLRRASRLLSNSAGLESVLRTRHGSTPPVTVVPCAASVDWFAGAVAGREQERCRRGVSDRIVLCYLGGLSSWQCIAETIQLAMRLRREIPEIYFLLLTPDNPQSYRRQLDQIGRDGVDYAVRSVAADEVPVALSAVDAGFLLREDSPVNRVASPTKCGEYLAAGAPVICTRHAGDAAPVVETSGAGIVLGDKLPSDAEMVRLVGFLRDVRGDRQAWQEKAMTAARRYCDWASYEEALRVLYRSYRWPEGFPRLPVARARRHSS